MHYGFLSTLNPHTHRPSLSFLQPGCATSCLTGTSRGSALPADITSTAHCCQAMQFESSYLAKVCCDCNKWQILDQKSPAGQLPVCWNTPKLSKNVGRSPAEAHDGIHCCYSHSWILFSLQPVDISQSYRTGQSNSSSKKISAALILLVDASSACSAAAAGSSRALRHRR